MSKLRYKDSNGNWQSIAPSQKEFDDFKSSTTVNLNGKASVNDVNNLSSNKADKTYVDSNISTLDNKINSQASGSPKGVYATTTDLQNAFPSGNSNIYVVTADGKWYYWNGSAWTAGGTYQSTSIADNSILTNYINNNAVTSEKTNFITQSANIFDKNTVTNNSYIDNSGNITSSTILCYSDFIPVKPNDTITISTGFTSPGASYDKNKSRVGLAYTAPSSATSPYTFTVPANVYYLRINLYMSSSTGGDKATYMVVKGNSLPSSYVAYLKYITSLKVTKDNLDFNTVSNEKLVEEAVSVEKIKGHVFENMFIKDTATSNKYIDNTGVITDSATLSYSDYIPVVEGQSYTVTKGYTSQGAVYDINKKWIAKIDGLASGEQDIWTFTIPSNGVYVRLNFTSSLLDTWMMVQGSTYPKIYKPYGASISWLRVADRAHQKWYGKTIVTFGDSITWYDGQPYGSNTKESGVIAKGYQSYMRDELDVIVKNEGVSGYTTPQINSVIQGYNFVDVDAVTILAGTNDFRDMGTELTGSIQPIGSTFDNTTFIGAYQEAIEHILNTNPEIKIYLFAPIKAWTDANGLMPETYPNAVLDIAKLYSLNVLDLYRESGINDLTKGVYIVDSDTVTYDFHPSTKGYERVANIMIPFLINH